MKTIIMGSPLKHKQLIMKIRRASLPRTDLRNLMKSMAMKMDQQQKNKNAKEKSKKTNRATLTKA